MVSRNCLLRFAILSQLQDNIEPGVDMFRLSDRLATNGVEEPPRFDQPAQSQRCRIRPILAANG